MPTRKVKVANALLVLVLGAMLASIPIWAHAQASSPSQQQPANEQVIVPQVDRRPVKLPRFPSKDFEFGVFAGTYSTESFGASGVAGIKAGYHITEDIFVEGRFAQTKVSDESFRQVLPGGIFSEPEKKLTYYNVSAGYNVLPGEVFIGSKRAKATAIYLIGGVGSTKFNEQRKQTYNFGLGLRLLLADRWALNVDLRDHIFTLDLLGKRQSTQNIELTGGLSFYF